ncbi:MAG: hydrogenase-1 expression HyaE [Hyphomicrobium sp.]
MTTPLIEALITRHGFACVDETTVDTFLAAHETALLFFPGDAERLVESNDVAVILPEIMKAYGTRITPALVASASERTLQKRYLFNAFPTIVFLRQGGYLGHLSRVLDWQDNLSEIPAILARDVTIPKFEFPEGCYTNGLKRDADNAQQGDFQ